VVPPASSLQVSEWVESVAGPTLKVRADRIAQIEQSELPPPEQSDAEVRRLLEEAGNIADRESRRPQPSDEIATLVEDATHASVFSDVHRPKVTRRRASLVLALLVAAGVSALFVMLLKGRVGIDPGAGASAPGAAPSPSAGPPSAPGAVNATPAATSSDVIDVRDLPEAVDSASASPPRGSRAPRRLPAAKRSAPTKADCDPPYTVDPTSGIKRYKPQCF
jgi:hypothetical protein